MDSIVSHKGYWCKVVHEGWKVRTWRSERTGQAETIVFPRKIYVPLGDFDDPAAMVARLDQSGTVYEQEQKERARQLSKAQERSRAKTKCRHRIKSHDLRQMLTGTYKENMLDFDRARKDFGAFIRLMSKHIKDFAYVCGFEQQERGAWHWHCAVHRMPPFIMLEQSIRCKDGSWRKVAVPVRSYAFVRQMWLRVVGSFDGKPNGTVNVDGHNRSARGKFINHKVEQSLARIAGYVSKYLTKDHGDGLSGRQMWVSSQGLDSDKPVVVEIAQNVPLYAVIDLMLVNGVRDGHYVVQHRLGRFKDFWLLYTEPICRAA